MGVFCSSIYQLIWERGEVVTTLFFSCSSQWLRVVLMMFWKISSSGDGLERAWFWRARLSMVALKFIHGNGVFLVFDFVLHRR